MQPIHDELERRLARVERSHRRLKQATTGIIIAALAAAVLGAKTPPEGTSVAKSLQIVDDDGKVRILINPRAGVSLLDREGRPRAVLSVDKTGPGLALYGETSRAGTILNVDDGGPTLAMRDNAGNTRALLTAIGAGPALIMSDEKSNERIALIQRAEGPSLSFIDSLRRITWSAP